jgi:hypothetical protein
LNFDPQSWVTVEGLKIHLFDTCYRLVGVVLWVEAQSTNHVAAAVPLGVSAMSAVFVAGFDYIVVLQSAVVVGEVAQGAA